MRSNNLASGLHTDASHVAAGEVCDTPPVAGKAMGLPGGRGSPIEGGVLVTVVRLRARPEPGDRQPPHRPASQRRCPHRLE
jgi:hypothetical protein